MKTKKHAEDLIEILATAIEAGTAPWQRPWACDAEPPTNLATGRVYTGRNVLMLSAVGALKGYSDHRWAGLHQIKAAGGHVRRGEQGHWICIMRNASGGRRRSPEQRSCGDAPPDTDRKTADRGDERSRGSYVYTTYRPVWNAAQCENIPPLEPTDDIAERKLRRVAIGEAYIAGAPVTVDIALSNYAGYRASSDTVMLPLREQFDEPTSFYQTALHELAHATGHPSRLDRGLENNSFGSADYIREELVAEIAAFIAGTAAGLGHGPGDSASYISSWLNGREDVRTALRGAVDEATKAVHLLEIWQTAGRGRPDQDHEPADSPPDTEPPREDRELQAAG